MLTSKPQKRRNTKWAKEKQIRRLDNLRSELGRERRNIEYIPLEKPIFAGWDIHLGLTYEASFRKDAEELQRVLNSLNLSRQAFTKNVKLVKFIRQNNFHIDSYKKFHGIYLAWFYDMGNRHINFHDFHNIPESLKKWFIADRQYKYSTDLRPYFKVRYDFPWYACRLYINKSYYNYRGIPNSEVQSEYDKIPIYPDVIKLWYRGDWKSHYKTRGVWKSCLKEIVSKQMTEEILDYNFKGCFDRPVWS